MKNFLANSLVIYCSNKNVTINKIDAKTSGFTLIEIVIFIVIMGIIGVTILAAMNTVLHGVSKPIQQDVATQTATGCLGWYLKQRDLHGFNVTTLSCPNSTTPSFCAVPSGYNIATNVSCVTLYGEATANYKTITVTITGLGNATLSLLLADY